MRTFGLALLLAAPVLGLPFSHKAHLALKLECKGCHAPAWKSTSAADNLLPEPDKCGKCHQNARIPPPRATKLAHFNHARHVQMGNLAPLIARAIDTGKYLAPGPAALRKSLDTANACLACHRGIDADKPVHDPMRQMADCLVCHNQIAPPESCELCHAKGAALKPASHTPDFMDSHTGGKLKLDKTTCAVCHGRNFTCLGCH